MIKLSLLYKVGGLLLIFMSAGRVGFLILGTLWILIGTLEAILSEMRDRK